MLKWDFKREAAVTLKYYSLFERDKNLKRLHSLLFYRIAGTLNSNVCKRKGG